MKLLVDEMYSPALAVQLRARDHDVVAVNEVGALAGASDRALLDWAAAAGRAILTENVTDFLILHAACLRTGERHGGIVLAPNASFPRGSAATIGALVKALDRLLADVPALDTDVHWLPR